MDRSVKFDLIADPKGFVRGFRIAEQQSTHFQRHMQGLDRSLTRHGASFAALGGAAKAGAAGAIVAFGGLTAAGVSLGLKTAAGLESAEIGFTRLLKSGVKARSFLADLKTFAARTPFELPGLIDAARGLVGAGTAAKNVIPILTALGDASGALGLDQERFGRVMVAVTQIMNKGKVQAEELMQINEAGIPVFQLLAKATGKPVPELQKLMEQGKLLSKDVLPALFDQMQKDYGGGMEDQAASLNGVWSTFKDTVSLTLSDALQPLLPWLKETLPNAGKIFQDSIAAISRFFKEDLAPQLDRVKAAWDDNKDAFTGLIDEFVNGTGKIGETDVSMRQLGDDMVELVNFTADGIRAMRAFGEWLDSVEDSSARLGKSIHDKFIIPFIDMLRQLGNVGLTTFEKLIGIQATVAEALHLPAARALRKAEGGIRDYRIHFNAEMDKLKNEDVLITASPRFQFSKSFTQTDWLAARSAAGRRAMGGPIFGPGTGTSDSVPIWASRGEHVWTAREVTAAGGHGAMERWRQATLRGDVPGFAGGGAIPRHQLGSMPSQVGQFPTARHGIASLMGNWTGGILTAALKKLFTGKPGILNFIRSTDRLPYVWGAAGPGGYDCSGLVSAVLGKMTGRGGGQGQRYFTTASIRPGILGIRSGLGGTLQIGVTPGRGHMAGRYGGLGFEAESTRTGIKIGAAASRPESFARHYHLAKGGAITAAFKPMAELLRREGVAIGGDPGKLRIDRFDRGGWLMPGATLAYNGTGRPEPVGGGGFVWHGDIKVYTTSGDPNAIGVAVRRQVVAVLDERARQARKGARA